MSSTSALKMMLERLGFSRDAATYLTSGCGIDSLEEIAYLDSEDNVDTKIKDVTSLVGTVTTGSGSGATSDTLCQNCIPV
jgi:hypothetical protein